MEMEIGAEDAEFQGFDDDADDEFETSKHRRRPKR